MGKATAIATTTDAPPKTTGKEGRRFALWIRVPNDDLPAVAGAVSSWVGDIAGEASVAFRIRAAGGFLERLVNGSSEELFAP